ncbi:uncharacterized protein SPSK_10041 [Sporothrix schenckii 1099-18]|uniref:Uncharacterized protein n=1 Tax=Sporothrix schenckii 1099-18 TaxID=1397361 RepID=A0A0F2M4C8_SPOSC|nr:uncharacterized protein SPSK_10041 [Sporothrix schenckii 1099-18]KJR84568.1 hypothetical protein SPSK_10041 [Sporothrix schenckii 1099-18]
MPLDKTENRKIKRQNRQKLPTQQGQTQQGQTEARRQRACANSDAAGLTFDCNLWVNFCVSIVQFWCSQNRRQTPARRRNRRGGQDGAPQSAADLDLEPPAVAAQENNWPVIARICTFCDAGEQD